MSPKCRIWWPKLVSRCRPPSSTVLFGWYVSCSASLDIVVAFACDEASISQCHSSLQGILHNTNGKLPVLLQGKSTFSIVGHCAAESGSNSPVLSDVNDEDHPMESSSSSCESPLCNPDISVENCELKRCGCCKVGGLLEQFRKASVRNSNWIQLLYDSDEFHRKNIHWVPKFHHIHQNRQLISGCDVHVLIYETPAFGGQHFSLGYSDSSEQVRSLKKPKWVNELHQKQQLIDLDTIILALNSASAAKAVFEKSVGLKGSCARFPIVHMFAAFTWQLFALSIASWSTFFYLIFQCLHNFLSYQLDLRVVTLLAKAFANTRKLFKIRCFQILYWPIFLQDNGIRSQSCVEYAERAALRKHSMWSRMAVDVLLGNLIGLALLCHTESVCLWVLNFTSDITDNLLRTGCVWLMGDPAGFKLNTELAEILGMMSLNVIQIWSTLWFFVGFCFPYFIKGIAVSGLLFGASIPAAVIIDMIALTTSHIAFLHWLISLVYSHQIQALAALWRLFRGWKWNPLRKRLDSYHYTVEQHIVGSLLFTPLLLLLPTTSVFYIFFAIMNTSVSLTCILIEITVSIVHATPYFEILIWLVNRRRFPSGIWFDILSLPKKEVNASEMVKSNQSGLSSGGLRQRIDKSGSCSGVLVSFLHSNSMDIGHVVLPHYRQIFYGVSGPFVFSLAYGVLMGRRIPSTIGSVAPSKFPWMFIPCNEYWRLCRDSVMACFGERDSCQS